MATPLLAQCPLVYLIGIFRFKIKFAFPPVDVNTPFRYAVLYNGQR